MNRWRLQMPQRLLHREKFAQALSTLKLPQFTIDARLPMPPCMTWTGEGAHKDFRTKTFHSAHCVWAATPWTCVPFQTKSANLATEAKLKAVRFPSSRGKQTYLHSGSDDMSCNSRKWPQIDHYDALLRCGAHATYARKDNWACGLRSNSGDSNFKKRH